MPFMLPPDERAPERRVQTVDELSAVIKSTINGSPALRGVAVRGELENFKRHSSGHVYFTLLGRESRISGVLFRSHASGVISWPEDGDEVMVTGSVDVYPKGGSYQLYATRILPLGAGAKSRAKEELRAVLEREGLFDVRHKRPLPRYPSKVAVVTSPTGAALQDILKVSLGRSPFVNIVIIPAMVQGVEAPSQVADALASVRGMSGIDCLILARGGGARDDLSPFDDERVVRAVRSCPVPVVTGVGHETDRSLADMAADAALPTPSAAAERVFPDRGEISSLLSHRLDLISSGVLRTCEAFSSVLERSGERLGRMMGRLMQGADASLDLSEKRLSFGITRVIERNEAAIASAASTLDALSPLAVLGRGYAICRDSRGAVVNGVATLGPGDAISLRFKDGTAEADITKITSQLQSPE
jgi:exodeoxyribonuclease VII large subunit